MTMKTRSRWRNRVKQTLPITIQSSAGDVTFAYSFKVIISPVSLLWLLFSPWSSIIPYGQILQLLELSATSFNIRLWRILESTGMMAEWFSKAIIFSMLISQNSTLKNPFLLHLFITMELQIHYLWAIVNYYLFISTIVYCPTVSQRGLLHTDGYASDLSSSLLSEHFFSFMALQDAPSSPPVLPCPSPGTSHLTKAPFSKERYSET